MPAPEFDAEKAFNAWHDKVCCASCDASCTHRGWELKAWLEAFRQGQASRSDIQPEKIRIHADDLMVIAAFRYSLGRSSYIVPACVDWLLCEWERLEENSRKLIVKEIKETLIVYEAKKEIYKGNYEWDNSQWRRILEHADAQAGG